jgi:hypothetical protein
MSARGDAGFTLPEAMIAGALGLLVALPGFHMLAATYRMVAAAESVALTNAAARQTFALLADGTSTVSNVEVAQAGASSSARGFALVEGLRSRQALPAGSSLRSASQFTLGDGALLAAGDTMAPLTVQCAGPATPIPDCTGAEIRTVQGWIGADPTVTAPSAQIGASQTAAVSVAVTNPFEAQRPGGAAAATERYRMMFNLNPDASW